VSPVGATIYAGGKERAKNRLQLTSSVPIDPTRLMYDWEAVTYPLNSDLDHTADVLHDGYLNRSVGDAAEAAEDRCDRVGPRPSHRDQRPRRACREDPPVTLVHAGA
jgi:hypothetical protein